MNYVTAGIYLYQNNNAGLSGLNTGVGDYGFGDFELAERLGISRRIRGRLPSQSLRCR